MDTFDLPSKCYCSHYFFSFAVEALMLKGACNSLYCTLGSTGWVLDWCFDFILISELLRGEWYSAYWPHSLVGVTFADVEGAAIVDLLYPAIAGRVLRTCPIVRINKRLWPPT